MTDEQLAHQQQYYLQQLNYYRTPTTGRATVCIFCLTNWCQFHKLFSCVTDAQAQCCKNVCGSFLRMFILSQCYLSGIVKARGFSGVALYGRFLDLPSNIRLGWKSLPGTNTSILTNIDKLRPLKVS